MLADTLRAVRGVRRADKVFVVTNYEPAMRAAKENGWELLLEEQQISESVSVDAASGECEKRGITAGPRGAAGVSPGATRGTEAFLEGRRRTPAPLLLPARGATPHE